MSEQISLILFCAIVTVTRGALGAYAREDHNAKPCGIGQFYFDKNVTRDGQGVYQRCKLCPQGSYNDHNADVTHCSACPWDENDAFVHTIRAGATSVKHCVSCAGWCDGGKSECYTERQICDGRRDCKSGQDEMNCKSEDDTDDKQKSKDKQLTTSSFQKYSWFFFIPVPFVICAGFGKLYHTAQKNQGLPVNAETGSPIRIHYRPHVSGRGSRSGRSRRTSQGVTIEMPLIPNSSATIIPNGHSQVVRSPSSMSQRTRSSQGSVRSIPGQHLIVEERASRRSSSTSQRSRSGSHSSRSFSRSPRLGSEGDRQRNSSRVVQPAVLVLPNQLPPRHVPLGASVSLPPAFPYPSPMSTTSHPPGSPPLPVITSSNGSPPPPSYDEVITSTDVYPRSPPHTDEQLPTYEAATRSALSSTSSA